MRPLDVFQRYMIRRLEARQRGASLRHMLDFAIGVCALGAMAMIGAAFALRAPELGVEMGSRLVFVLCLLLAVRLWVKR
jgi:hypothetical protein